MGFFGKLKALVRRAPSSAAGDEPLFDPRIMRDFEAEVADWPRERAFLTTTALRVALAGERASFDALCPKLKIRELQLIEHVVARIAASSRR